MKSQETTIAGKKATLAYCYATEIAYKMLSGQDINDFMKEAALALSDEPPRMPDVKSTVLLIIAAANAWYDSKREESPVKDTDIMYAATPEEMGKALGVIIALRKQFYDIPVGEPESDEKAEEGEQGKN